ncbi:transcription factor VIP1-like, partial [Bidens hawaiensis]|uniref:transcription factor VIP1-like n=1 Tax=Bidens hawaiensis TaxID=980011 RepID=UPI004048F242
MMDPNFSGKPIPISQYYPTGRKDLDQMPETPSRSATHRRTQSETFFPFPDEETILDDVVADFNFTNFTSIDLPSLSGEAPASGDVLTKPESNSPARKSTGYGTHLRSLSVDSDFFEELGLSGAGDGGLRHRHSNSMDGSSIEGDSVLMLLDNSKKALAPDK